MRYKNLFLFFAVVYGLTACTGGKNHKFVIIGNITSMPEQTIMLEQIGADDVVSLIDSVRSDANGRFEITDIASEPGLYRLHFIQKKFILLSIDKGNMRITGDWKALSENYQLAGSASSENLRRFVKGIRDYLRDFNTMSIVIDTLQTKGNDSMLALAKSDFEQRRTRFTEYVENYADTTQYLPNAVFAAKMLNPATEYNFLESFTQSIGHRFPNARMTKDFEQYYRHVSSMQPSRAGNMDVNVMAANITLFTPDEQSVSLYSLRGKYVLLDFWASWCAPCRGENPNVVAAYEKYKNKNFTVYSVSLDSKKDVWEKAIKEDGLTWTQVSDLKGWDSPVAAEYNVQSIPTNFLLDPTGRIIAHDLRGSDLDKTLSTVLK